ncbi:hypothetical protein KQI86_16635 [Clostridium sp. MSJ-11]|uniref:Uncharacterized protein n=1 Tax=Clostridium mobile TaxID=2841512 RepID=A0ABS6ENH8_9CLOT|nr:hypothetical protein [Clostridium mobile]MBU5485950.1 hypothetical protein [Clostridium mobile]
MIEVSLIELFGRAIPEGFLFIFALYVFSGHAINKRDYLISSILMSIITFTVRLLPIHYGVHTILNIIGLIVLNVSINKIDIVKSIQAVIITVILQFICEGINVFIIQYIFKTDMNYVFGDSKLKILYGIPSLLIFTGILTLYYIRLLKRKELNHV